MAVKSEDDMPGEIYYEGISPLKGIKKWAMTSESQYTVSLSLRLWSLEDSLSSLSR